METTTSCPVVASSVLSPLPDPPKKPPPWMCTSTGRWRPPGGFHTFRKRQSSLDEGTVGLRHSFPNAVAANGVVHRAGACGGAQRRAPTGGAAYGIPSHSPTPLTTIPHTGPLLVRTSVPGAQPGAAAAVREAATVAATAATASSVTAATIARVTPGPRAKA